MVCDDGSTDGSVAIIEQVCGSAGFPVRVIRSSGNVGVKENFEKAISLCTGEFIALADQDDIWYEDKLEVFSVAIMASDQSVPTLFYSDLDLIDSQGEILGDTFLARVKMKPPTEDYWKLLAARNFAPGCSTVFDIRLRELILPLPPQSIIHDWWINILFSLCGSICRVDTQTMQYRLHEGNNQGIGSFQRSLEIGVGRGFVAVTSSNFVLAIRQLKAALVRLDSNGLCYPEQLDQLADLFASPAVVRPIILVRTGIRRGSVVKTLLMLLASVLVSRGQFENETATYI